MSTPNYKKGIKFRLYQFKNIFNKPRVPKSVIIGSFLRIIIALYLRVKLTLIINFTLGASNLMKMFEITLRMLTTQNCIGKSTFFH